MCILQMSNIGNSDSNLTTVENNIAEYFSKYKYNFYLLIYEAIISTYNRSKPGPTGNHNYYTLPRLKFTASWNPCSACFQARVTCVFFQKKNLQKELLHEFLKIMHSPSSTFHVRSSRIYFNDDTPFTCCHKNFT